MPPGVLQLISSSGFFGAERVLVELASYLGAEGWPCHVGAFLQRGEAGVAVEQHAREQGLPTVLFPCEAGFDSRVMARIRRFVSDEGIRVVHSHGYKADIFAYLSRLQPGVKLVSTCHNWLTDSLKLMVYELLDKLALHQFDQVVAVSPPLTEELAAAGIAPGRRCLIENGLAGHERDRCASPAGRGRMRRELGLPDGAPLVTTIGRLDPWKGYDLLLEAFAEVARRSPARLMIVGDGDLRRPLEDQARDLGIGDRVIFTGYRRDIGDLLAVSDIFVISSRKEGLPMVLLEAMAASLPVVATRVGAIPGALDKGACGDLVPSNDPPALAAAILSLVQDPGRRERLARQARGKYHRCYSREAMGQQYVALYERLLSPTCRDTHK